MLDAWFLYKLTGMLHHLRSVIVWCFSLAIFTRVVLVCFICFCGQDTIISVLQPFETFRPSSLPHVMLVYFIWIGYWCLQWHLLHNAIMLAFREAKIFWAMPLWEIWFTSEGHDKLHMAVLFQKLQLVHDTKKYILCQMHIFSVSVIFCRSHLM